MEKIGFIELANHNEVLRAYLIQVLAFDEVKVIYVFTSSWIYDQLYDFQKHHQIEWIILSNDSQLDSHSSLMKSLDVVIATTIEDHQGSPLNLPSIGNLGAVIHKTHTYFFPIKKVKFDPTLKDLYRLFRLITVKRKAYKKSLNAVDFYLFPTKYAQDLVTDGKPSIVSSFAANDGIAKALQRNKISITIPGIITNKSRNYKEVIKALEQVNISNIELSLLGRPQGQYGDNVIHRLKKIKTIKVKSYTGFIPQQQFDKVMKDTDFLILPMNKEMKFGVVQEKNGYSCVSGNMNDLIRYGLPALYPSFYPIDDALTPVTESYTNSEHLAELITQWCTSRKYNDLKNLYMDNAMQDYHPTSMGRKLLENLRRVKQEL